MHLQNRLTPLDVRPVQHDAPVKPARPQQRGIQDVRAICGSHHDHVRIGIEAVHLDQNLVQRLFPLVVGTAQAGAPVASHGIDLVQKHDARTVSLGLLKQVAHARRAYADEHLDELGAGDGEERNPRLPTDRLGQQRLTRSRSPHQEHALGDARPKLDELLGLLEKLDHLA